MVCNGCGNSNATIWQLIVTKKYGRQEKCDKCGIVSSPVHSDVYWGGQHTNPNITDEHGTPIFLESREHKARIMREKGIIEAGDKVHGAPYLPGRRPGDYSHAKKR